MDPRLFDKRKPSASDTNDNKSEVLDNPNALIRFLTLFPENEIWRFFVERIRYNNRKEWYETIYEILHPGVKHFPPVEEIRDEIKHLSFADVFAKADDDQKSDLQTFLSRKDPNQSLIELLDKEVGWYGFEQNEQGYLLGCIQGLTFILNRLIERDTSLILNFIIELNKITTENVKNLLPSHQPGQFRKKEAAWTMDTSFEADSLAGWEENFSHLIEAERKYGKKLFSVIGFGDEISPDGRRVIKNEIKDFAAMESADEAVGKLVECCSDSSLDIKLVALHDGTPEHQELLKVISEDLINQYNANIQKAKNKEEKLFAIFLFLKLITLHHIFQDGVGRTFSMTLIQFLLLKENLLPELIPNSNCIPGLSVKELVKIYLDAEKEMESTLKDPKFIESKEFYKDNVQSDKILEQIKPAEKAYFMGCIELFTKTKKDVLDAALKRETKSEKRKGTESEEPSKRYK